VKWLKHQYFTAEKNLNKTNENIYYNNLKCSTANRYTLDNQNKTYEHSNCLQVSSSIKYMARVMIHSQTWQQNGYENEFRNI